MVKLLSFVALAAVTTLVDGNIVPSCHLGQSVWGVDSLDSPIAPSCCYNGVCYSVTKDINVTMLLHLRNVDSFVSSYERSSQVKNRSKRDLEEATNSRMCEHCFPEEIAVCRSSARLLFPLSAISVSQGKRVGVLQAPPYFVQPVIFNGCVDSRCRILGGKCKQVFIPQAVIVIEESDGVSTAILDLVYLEHGCECQPDNLPERGEVGSLTDDYLNHFMRHLWNVTFNGTKPLLMPPSFDFKSENSTLELYETKNGNETATTLKSVTCEDNQVAAEEKGIPSTKAQKSETTLETTSVSNSPPKIKVRDTGDKEQSNNEEITKEVEEKTLLSSTDYKESTTMVFTTIVTEPSLPPLPALHSSPTSSPLSPVTSSSPAQSNNEEVTKDVVEKSLLSSTDYKEFTTIVTEPSLLPLPALHSLPKSPPSSRMTFSSPAPPPSTSSTSPPTSLPFKALPSSSSRSFQSPSTSLPTKSLRTTSLPAMALKSSRPRRVTQPTSQIKTEASTRSTASSTGKQFTQSSTLPFLGKTLDSQKIARRRVAPPMPELPKDGQPFVPEKGKYDPVQKMFEEKMKNGTLNTN